MKMLSNENVSDIYKIELLEKYNYLFNYPHKYVNNNIYKGICDQW